MTSIWRELSSWPPEQRLALANRLLESVQQKGTPATVPEERQQALRELVGIWKTDQPPNQEQVKQVLEEERMKKYG